MKKNGFTFIEILGVITLLSLLSIIVLISVNHDLKKSKLTLSEVQIENIKSAASMWRTDHIEVIPSSGYCILTLGDLIDLGYINDVVDPNSDSNYDNDLTLGIGMNDIRIDSQDNLLILSGYTKLDYIKSTGTQYIDLDYVPKIEDVYSMTIQPLVLDSNQVFLGSRSTGTWVTSNDQVYINQSNSGDSKNKLLFFSGTGKTVYSELSLGQQYNYNFEVSNGYYNGSGSNNLYLFALNNAGTVVANSNIKLYMLKIYNGNTLIRNFVPVKRNSDNLIGLYDEVNGVFYTNSGTGNFEYGELE